MPREKKRDNITLVNSQNLTGLNLLQCDFYYELNPCPLLSLYLQINTFYNANGKLTWISSDERNFMQFTLCILYTYITDQP